MRSAPWFDRDYVQTASDEMQNRGMMTYDSLWAAAAGSCMLALDKACMPAGVPRGLVEYTLRRHTLIIARCHHAVPRRRERYEIFVVGFRARMKVICVEHQLKRQDMTWYILNAAMAVAAHEVRHRLQRRMPGLVQFTPFCNPGSDKILKAIVAVESERFRENNQRLRKDAKGKILANMFHNFEEFDACVVERLVMRRGLACRTVDELAHLVLSEPTL